MPSRKGRKGRRAGGSAPAAPRYTAQQLELIGRLAEAILDGDNQAGDGDTFMRQTCLQTLPSSKPRHPLSGEALVTTLRLYAGAVRRSAGTAVLKNVLDIVNQLCPFSGPTNALTRLRISRAMLAAQPLHALSQQLAAAAAALEPCGGGVSGGGSTEAAAVAVEQGRTALERVLENAVMFYSTLLGDSDVGDLELPSPGVAAAVAAERAAGVEELARGLAESCVLEHAARVLLLLQARGPHAVRPREAADKTLAWEVLDLLDCLAGWATGPPCISPTAAALLYSALSSRCVQTAVLVYGVGTLRLVDRGPTYGLPAALQTAGLAMCGAGQRSPDLLSLVLLANLPANDGHLAMAGPGTSVELLLRTSRAALGSAAATLAPGLQPRGGVPLPAAPAVPMSSWSSGCSLLRLSLSALQIARQQLPARDASARQSQRREEWWRLAAGALAYGGELLQDEDYGTDPEAAAWELCQLVTEPLINLWSDGLPDLGALPAEPPAEVAAALTGGLPQALMALVCGNGTGALSAGSQCVASELLAACDVLFLTPLLAYGDPEWAAAFLAALGSAQGDGPAQAQAPPPTAQQAAGVVGAVAEALRRCGGAVLAGAEVGPSRVGAAEPAPLQQLRRVVALAEAQLGGLPPAP